MQHRTVGQVAELEAVEADPAARRTAAAGSATSGSGTLGASASTDEIFSSAAVADCSEL